MDIRHKKDETQAYSLKSLKTLKTIKQNASKAKASHKHHHHRSRHRYQDNEVSFSLSFFCDFIAAVLEFIELKE